MSSILFAFLFRKHKNCVECLEESQSVCRTSEWQTLFCGIDVEYIIFFLKLLLRVLFNMVLWAMIFRLHSRQISVYFSNYSKSFVWFYYFLVVWKSTLTILIFMCFCLYGLRYKLFNLNQNQFRRNHCRSHTFIHIIWRDHATVVFMDRWSLLLLLLLFW